MTDERNPRHFFGKGANGYYEKYKDYMDNKTKTAITKRVMPLMSEVTLSILPISGLKSSLAQLENVSKKTLINVDNEDVFDPLKFLFNITGLKTDGEKTEEKKDVFIIDPNKEYTEMHHKLSSLDDLIKLGKSYRQDHNYPFDLKKLHQLVPTLEKLDKMIGMKTVKSNIVDQIVYFLSAIEDNDNMMHTVITGSPGVGKTVLGRIIGEIYYHMGILQGNGKKHIDPLTGKQMDFVFKIAKRSDLIGEYLGHTAVKTQKVIDECHGGVLFIDEAYSLGSGNNDKKDSYAKECIDTLNQNLSEMKKKFICIIAGYPDELEKCFFSQNEGLRRRFPFRYDIEKYTPIELSNIFMSMVGDSKWSLDSSVSLNSVVDFMKENYDSFPYFGGDIENLLFHVKIAHAHRVMGLHPRNRKKIDNKDIQLGFDNYVKLKGTKKEENVFNHIYI